MENKSNQVESRNLTEKEEKVLVELIKSAEEMGDNGIEFCIEDVVYPLDLSVNVIKGVCASLSKKGLVNMYHGASYFDGEVSKKGFNYYRQYLENPTKPEDQPSTNQVVDKSQTLQKAEELAVELIETIGASNHSHDAIVNILIKMSEYKDKRFEEVMDNTYEMRKNICRSELSFADSTALVKKITEAYEEAFPDGFCEKAENHIDFGTHYVSYECIPAEDVTVTLDEDDEEEERGWYWKIKVILRNNKRAEGNIFQGQNDSAKYTFHEEYCVLCKALGLKPAHIY